MAKERANLGIAAAERAKDIVGASASPQTEDSFAEASAGLRNGTVVLKSDVLERREGVCGAHLSPLVAVVAGGVPSCEDMRERAEEAILGQWFEHRSFGRDTALERKNCARVVRIRARAFTGSSDGNAPPCLPPHKLAVTR